MWRDRPNLQRLDQTPVVIFSVVFLLLDPAPSPAFALDAGSDRKISANAVVLSSKVEAEEVSGKNFGKTKPIPYLSHPPSPPSSL